MAKKRNIAVLAAAAAVGSTFHMITEATVEAPPADQEALENLLADLDVPGDGTAETIEPADGVVVSAGAPVGELDETIEADADAIAARHALYANQGKDAAEALFGGQPEGDQPATAPEAVAETKEQKAARKKVEKEAKASAREAERERKKAEKAARAPRPTSVTHQPGDLLVAKLGTGWRDLVVFTNADAASENLAAIQDAFVVRMNDRDAIADKVKEKAIMLFTFLQKGGELNEVMKRAFTVLHAKGELTSGDKGNLQQNLLSKPYSVGTARSQSNQMFMLFPELGITVKEKGRMVPNPDSVLLPLINARLGLVDDAS